MSLKQRKINKKKYNNNNEANWISTKKKHEIKI